MPSGTARDWPSTERLRELVYEHGGNMVHLGRVLGCTDMTVTRHLHKVGLTEDVKIARSQAALGAERSVSSADPKEWGDIEALVRRRGLKPADWAVVGARVNEWADQRQLRVDLKPRRDMLAPARTDGWKAPRVPKKKVGRDGELVAFFGDHHAPHHDQDLHRAVCQWLRDHQPHRGVILGDLLDLDRVSRHRPNEEWTAGVQETLDAGWAILRAYIEASPQTRWVMLDGNHEARVKNAVIDQLPGLSGVRKAGGVGDPVLSMPHLLRLDELGVEHVTPGGEYQHEQVMVSPELAARHGWIARKGSGASALATLNHLRFSVVIGHTHRQSQVFHTAHSIDGTPRTLTAVEAGTLATVSSAGLGYAVSPDWQAGFATATIWKDGTFKIDLATFVSGSLMWRGWRCQP